MRHQNMYGLAPGGGPGLLVVSDPIGPGICSILQYKFGEFSSLLKNSLGARIGPGVGTEYADLGAFRSRFVVAISSMSTFSTGCPPSTHSGA
jgi:hypothetical protein